MRGFTVITRLSQLAALVYWSGVFGAANATTAWEPVPEGWSRRSCGLLRAFGESR